MALFTWCSTVFCTIDNFRPLFLDEVLDGGDEHVRQVGDVDLQPALGRTLLLSAVAEPELVQLLRFRAPGEKYNDYLRDKEKHPHSGVLRR